VSAFMLMIGFGGKWSREVEAVKGKGEGGVERAARGRLKR